MSHTPGPWMIDHRQRTSHAIPISAPDRWYELAAVIVRMEDDGHDCDDGLGNARLIAAAPDLLEALKAIVALPAHPMRKKAVEIANAAIAKATGESPEIGDSR